MTLRDVITDHLAAILDDPEADFETARDDLVAAVEKEVSAQARGGFRASKEGSIHETI